MIVSIMIMLFVPQATAIWKAIPLDGTSHPGRKTLSRLTRSSSLPLPPRRLLLAFAPRLVGPQNVRRSCLRLSAIALAWCTWSTETKKSPRRRNEVRRREKRAPARAEDPKDRKTERPKPQTVKRPGTTRDALRHHAGGGAVCPRALRSVPRSAPCFTYGKIPGISMQRRPFRKGCAGQGEPLVWHYLSNTCFLQRWRIM